MPPQLETWGASRPLAPPLPTPMLFEAQFHLDFKSVYHTHRIVIKSDCYSCPLDRYALGYCIAHISPQVSWDITLESNSDEGFMWGLKSASSVSGNLECLSLCGVDQPCLEQYPIQFLHCIKRLGLYIIDFHRTVAYTTHLQLIFLVEAIPQMKSLTVLSLNMCIRDRHQLVIPELGSVISHSNVSTLKLSFDYYTTECSTEVFYGSMAVLMQSKTLRSFDLIIKDSTNKESETYPKRLFDILFGPSFLCALSIYLGKTRLTENCFASLMSNTSLTTLSIQCADGYLPVLTKLLIRNSTLQVLAFGDLITIFPEEDILAFYSALRSNTTLQKLVVFYHGPCGLSSDADSRLMIKRHITISRMS